MDTRRTVSPESALASDIFDKFCGASTLKSILAHYRQLCSVLRIKPTHFPDFYPRLRTKLSSWRAQGLWAKFEKRASHKCYGRGKACYGTRVLIIGSGPCGLRAAIEAQLLGAKVVLVEKRDRLSRNNVLHLWPFVITDLKGLGAKKFYGKFCAGSIDHISIRQIQCILLKVALLLGVEVHEGVSFEGLRQPTENEGWRAVTSPSDHPVSHYTFDVLIGADGRRNTLDGFRRKALRAKLAIAITANFINKHTEAEARVKEISGVSYIFNQKFFQDLNEATGIDLENIVYYKDETHYFVMTAKKQSLLQKGVLLHDYADTAKLLSYENISTENLMIYALEAAIFSTENQLPNLEFAVNHYGQPDVAMFDFTAMYQAENACRVVQRKNHKLLMTLVGDSLLEPFWPTGSGCARGFLSSFDACWMIRSWSGGTRSPLEVMAERESIYRLLAQTTPENLNKEHTSYTIDPHSRYPNLNLRAVMPFQVKSLYDTDETIPDVTDSVEGQQLLEAEKLAKKRRRDSVIAVDALLSWMRDQVSCYGLEMSDVRDAFVRGDVLCAIIHRFRPDLIEFPLPSEENVEPLHTAAFRNQHAFDLLHEEYGLTHVMSGWESVQSCSPDFLSCVAYLSQVYEIFRGEIPQIKYPRVESCEDLEEAEQRSSQPQFKYTIKPHISSKHHHHGSGKPAGRRSRMSSSGRESREGDSETSARRHKKRRSEDRSSRSSVSGSSGAVAAASSNSGREIRTTLGGHGSRRGGDGDSEKNVPGLARDLEAKLKGRPIETDKQKPKDLIRAIGKIEKTDWNVQLIEKKIAESKGPSQAKADRDDKVPRWSREAFDDKREALKRKMEGVTASADGDSNERFQLFEETMKKLGSKLKEGNALEVGQRGSNKVSAMAEQLVHKLEKPEQSVPKQPAVARPVFEFPKKGGSECCHFCKERVYVVERMTAEGKFFHRNCFRCEYCNTALRVGNYVFDREGRYGDRFFCTAHYNTIWLYGWKKYDQELTGEPGAGGKAGAERVGHMVTPTSQQILSEMDERGTTPERVEFENSVECASEDDLLSEMDEDEWTDRNFGASNADNNTPDEASDLSDDEDITPEGNKVEAVNHQFVEESLPERPAPPEAISESPLKKEVVDSSDSDTEVASGEDSDGSLEDEEDEDEDEEDEGGGSTTEIETDSEFAEDPPHSVPGTIPTIVVDEPEQIVTRMIDSAPISHTQTPNRRDVRGHHGSRDHHHYHNHNNHQPLPPIYHIEDLNDRMVEPVKKGVPERSLPRVTAVPKKWEPMSINPEGFSSKMSLELKKKYLQGNVPVIGIGAKKPNQDAAAQNQFRSVLDMISEQQKLLQPAPKPSATMQAFLDGAEKLKNKTISPLSASPRALDQLGYDKTVDPLTSMLPKWTSAENEVHVGTTNGIINRDVNSASQEAADNTLNMNRLNLEKTIEACQQAEAVKKDLKQNKVTDEKQDVGKEKEHNVPDDANTPGQSDQPNAEMTGSLLLVNGNANSNESPMVLSDGMSQSETDTQSTIIVTNKGIVDPLKTPVAEKPFEIGDVVQKARPALEEDDDSDTETGSGEPLSDLDDLDIEDENPVKIEPPRVEIEDEFGGVTLAVDVDNEIDDSVRISSSDSRDSLNSGVFLETELSDWVKDGNDCSEIEPRERSAKKKSGHGKGRHGSRRREPHSGENEGSGHRETSHLALELEDMDFMDVDGLSSPEDQQVFIKRKEGYAKLETEEEGPESILPDFSVVLRTSDPHDDQPSPRTLERQQRPTYSSDEQDESGHSSTPTVESCSAGPKVEKSVSVAESVSKQDKSPKASPAKQQRTQIIEAINPVIVANRKQIEKANEIQLLDRVVPFSNARDSLDYRKMKGITSPIKSKDLYSTYCLPSVKGELCEEEDSHESSSGLPKAIGSPQQQSSSAQAALFGAGENYTQHRSPEMARKIEEIHKERAKQNDLIRSMVMGRIRKSPEKNSRRGSRGSLSPLGASSSSGASASGSSEHVLRCEDELVDSRRSSQNSILSHSNHSHDGGEETDESQRNSSSANEVEFPSRDSSSAAEPILKSGQVALSPTDLSGKSASSSQFSSENSIPHQKLQKSSSTSSQSPPGVVAATFAAPVRSPSHQQLGSQPQNHQPYEPVFTSSPRFRNRPKFENPLSVYQSVTNPPTPVNPSALSGFAATPAITPGSEASSSGKEQSRGEREPSTNKSIKVMKSHSPSFYRSMPDLSAFLVSSSSSVPHSDQTGSDGSSNESRGFATPDMKQWNAYKQLRGIAASTSVDREKARKAARERARLKSDEELGLSPTDYANLKEKVRRKASITDDDVFKSGSVPTTPVRETLRGGMIRKGRPMSDVFDAAFSLRPNVDFPITKTNPFLVSSPLHHDPRDMGIVDDDGWFNHHEPEQQDAPNLSEVEDPGFAHLKLRVSSPGKQKGVSERKISPEKAKSMGWHNDGQAMGVQEPGMPNYFSSATPTLSTSPPAIANSANLSRTPLSLTPRADGNWFFEKPESTLTFASRPRSNTLSDLNLSPGSLLSGSNNNSNSQSQGIPQNSPNVSTSQAIQSRLSSTEVPNGSTACTSDVNVAINSSNGSSGGHQVHDGQCTSTPVSVAKAKALSTDTLLDDSDSPTSPPERVKGVSVPDIAHSVSNEPRVSPERKHRKSKDRDRRRSLIQAVSDFFTIRGSSMSQAGSNNGSPTDKSGHSQSTSSGNSGVGNNGDGVGEKAMSGSSNNGTPNGGSGREKFSIFKLTPKILQSKERRNSKSREIISPPPPAPSGGPSPALESTIPPPKPARAAFSSYLAQPDMVIQRLTSSPTTYKSSRSNHGRSSMDGNLGGDITLSPTGSTAALSGLAGTVDHMATLSIVATPTRPGMSHGSRSRSDLRHHRNDNRSRMREMQEIQLQLESIEAQQRSLEARGVAVEKRIRGEEPDEKHREEAELMEEWFTLVREKTRMARFEKELLVRAEELELESRKERLEEQLDNSLLLNDAIKSPEDKTREIELLHELRAVEEQRGKLLTSFQDDMRQYENEDADLEAKIASSRLSPKESNV